VTELFPKPALELPVIESGPSPLHERTDAARNRVRILEAAERLFSEDGAEAVSMDAVAKAACVGKGTLYRRFGDRDGLLLAIIDERDQAFQEQLLHGEPPLGPGVPALERLHAFGPAYLGFLDEAGPVLAAFESRVPVGRLGGAPFSSYRLHLRILLEQANPACDAEFGAETLLALVRPSHVQHLLRLGISRERIVTGWCRTVDALTRS
jgi:AcrR family transcriptional regulator